MGKVSGRMNDLCLVNTPVYELQDDRLEPPLGLLYLATTAQKAGFDVSICDLGGIEKDLWSLPEASMYGFTTYSTTYGRTLELVALAREANPDAIMVAGGAHASALPQLVAEDFDHVVIGEGELAVCELLSGLTKEKIITGYPVEALDKLPFIDYSFVDTDSYHRIVDGKKSFTVLSSRGCPYGCLFCNSIVMGGHKRVRFRSPSFVVGEMMGIKKRYGDVNFRFGDDLFGGKRSWMEEFVTESKHLEDLTYRAFVRLNQCASDWGFTDMLAESGCKHIAVGLESGSDAILSAMGKGITAQTAIDGIRQAKAAGLLVRVYLIVGFPGETWRTVNETIDLVAKTKPDEFVVYPLIPYPGTPLYNKPGDYGLLDVDEDFTHYFQIHGNKESQFVYDLADVDRVGLQKMKDYMVDELEKMQLSWARDSKGYV